MNSNWFSITNKSDSEADVMIYAEIGGFGISAESFVSELKGIKAKKINLHLNTPGGSVFDGTAIYNALRAHPADVTVWVDGLAASMGSYIAMAGDEIRIAKNAFMMIHNPSGLVYGDAASMREMASLLDKLKGAGARVYADRTGKSKEYWMGKMDETAWYSAEEAKADGLADMIVDEDPQSLAVAASFDLSTFKNLPANLRQQIQAVSINQLGRTQATSRDAAVKATTTEFKMNDELFNKYAAENPESAAVKALQVRGRNAGVAEATAQARKDLKAMLDACPSRQSLAVESFLAGRDIETTKAMASAADAAAEEKDMEITKLKADLAKAQFNQGTQGAVGTAGAAGKAAADAAKGGDAKPAIVEDDRGYATLESAKAIATWEWDNNQQSPAGMASKEKYVGFKSRVLTGQISISMAPTV